MPGGLGRPGTASGTQYWGIATSALRIGCALLLPSLSVRTLTSWAGLSHVSVRLLGSP